MPAPSRLDNRFDVHVLRLPLERGLGQRGIGHQFWRIARAARADGQRNRMACNAAASVDDLSYTVAMPGPQVEFEALPTLKQFQCFDMGRGEIVDVDIVADAGP